MANLLVSFCNVFPTGLALGLYNFESDDFTWVDISAISDACLGVDGICWRDDGFWLLPQLAWGGISGLAMIDSNLNVRRSYKLTNTGDAHSLIAYQDGFLVTDTMRNRLNFIRIDGNGVLKESEYWRYCDEQTDVVHLNSVAQFKGDIYVSIFGPKPSEGWAFAANGQIINVSKNAIICDGLAHPHTLMEVDGMLYWLESRKGLHRFSERDGHQIVLHCGGYLRGLTYDDKYFYVAASALRRRSRSTGVPSLSFSENPEDMHSWIYRIDRNNLQIEKRELTAFGAEIYDLAIVKQNRSGSHPQKKRAGAVVQRIWKYEDEYCKLKDMHDDTERSLRNLHADTRKLLEELRLCISAFQLPKPEPEPVDLQAQLAERDKSILYLQQEISQLTGRIQALEAQLVEMEISTSSLKQQLASVYNSRRWRLATWLAEAYWGIIRLFNFIGLKHRR